MASTVCKNVVQKEIIRPVNLFPPNPWGDRFLNFTFDYELHEKYTKEIEGLKEQVKILITALNVKMVDMMDLIDKLERLGISYHFENEIEGNLERLFDKNSSYEDETYDLHTISTCFRIFRQHGYRINSDVLGKFKDSEGKFKEVLKNDVKGLLSLYEAAHLRIRGEDILEDALVFAKENLESIAPNLGSALLKKQVEHALFQALHYGHQRVETYHYISFYEEEETKNETLLKFAKLDYNVVQMLHKKEIHEMAKWWKESDLASKLPYARDRYVECHFWSMGALPSPKYSRARDILAKSIKLSSLVDDTYDAYGVVEELDKFNDAIQRWDMREIDRLPKYMKPLYHAILKTYEQFKEEIAEEGRSFTVDYAVDAFKEQVMGYNIEAKWFMEGVHMPSFSEFLTNALISGGYLWLFNAAILGTSFGTKREFEWLKLKPRMVVASQEVSRLLHEIPSFKIEKERGREFNGLDIYMLEYGVTMEEAIEKFRQVCADGWKDVNENMLNPYPCNKELLRIILNFTRMVDVLYGKNALEGYTFSEKAIKPHIFAVYIDPFKI